MKRIIAVIEFEVKEGRWQPPYMWSSLRELDISCRETNASANSDEYKYHGIKFYEVHGGTETESGELRLTPTATLHEGKVVACNEHTPS